MASRTSFVLKFKPIFVFRTKYEIQTETNLEICIDIRIKLGKANGRVRLIRAIMGILNATDGEYFPNGMKNVIQRQLQIQNAFEN